MIGQPAYRSMYEVLKREILEGEMAIGSSIPSESDLERRFDVSRTTVRRAVDLLTREGYVRPKQGRGTEVLDYKTSQNLNIVTSVSETLKLKGFSVRPKIMHIDIIPVSPNIAEDLEINKSDLVVCVHRIQLADETPIAIMKNYIPAYIVPGIENQAKSIDSLYKYLDERYNISIESAVDRISARNADSDEAEMLEIPVGTALIYMRRVCYSNTRPVCSDRTSIIGNKYELLINMFGRKKEY